MPGELDNLQNQYDETMSQAAEYNNKHFLFGGNAPILDLIFGTKTLGTNNLALLNTQAQNAYNSAEALKNRQWQEMMSSTAYQRSKKDLEAAGFSPLALIGGSGASTGSGGVAHAGNGFVDANASNAGLINGILKVASVLMGKPGTNIIKVVAGDDKSDVAGNSSSPYDSMSWDELIDALK